MPHSQSGCNEDEKNLLPLPGTEPWLTAYYILSQVMGISTGPFKLKTAKLS
jgi:hypothetical protein